MYFLWKNLPRVPTHEIAVETHGRKTQTTATAWLDLVRGQFVTGKFGKCMEIMENQFVELHTSKVKLIFVLCSLGETCEGYHMWRLENVFVHREKHWLYLGTYAQSTILSGKILYILMVQKSHSHHPT